MSGRGLAGMVLRAVSLEQNSVGLGHPVGQMGRHGQLPAFGRHPRHGVSTSLPEGVPRRFIGGVVCVRTPDVGRGGDEHPLPLRRIMAGQRIEQCCLPSAAHEGDNVSRFSEEWQILEAGHQTAPSFSATAIAIFSGVMGSS